MTIKDRFWDYINTNYECEDYTYDISIFECVIYGLVYELGIIASIFCILVFLPIWCVPYLIYKKISLKKEMGIK